MSPWRIKLVELLNLCLRLELCALSLRFVDREGACVPVSVLYSRVVECTGVSLLDCISKGPETLTLLDFERRAVVELAPIPCKSRRQVCILTFRVALAGLLCVDIKSRQPRLVPDGLYLR